MTGAVLARGVHGRAIRVARRINGALGVRGRVFGDSYHARELATPRAARLRARDAARQDRSASIAIAAKRPVR